MSLDVFVPGSTGTQPGRHTGILQGIKESGTRVIGLLAFGPDFRDLLLTLKDLDMVLFIVNSRTRSMTTSSLVLRLKRHSAAPMVRGWLAMVEMRNVWKLCVASSL